MSGTRTFVLLAGLASCAPVAETDRSDTDAPGVVRVVVFTHIEDQTPAGDLTDPATRAGYAGLRTRLLEVAALAHGRGLTWVLQPDWKFLEAALVFEDAEMTSDTAGRSVFVALRDDFGVTIDPHSHENGGYNYTDVANLLSRLEVGGSTVIGGHVWDPSLREFQHWDRFREPQAGLRYPTAPRWRGDVLIGAGTPDHVNDPRVSGVWRPLDKDHFFDHDPDGNIVAVGAWEDGVAGVESLIALHDDGTVPATQLLTASWNVQPQLLTATDGPAEIDATMLAPLAALQDAGRVEVVDFQSLVATWSSAYQEDGTLYRP